MKYLVREPPTLESLSIERLGEWIAAQATLLQYPLSEIHERNPATAELMLSRNIEVIRDYVERYLPCKLHDKLADALSSSLIKIEESLTSLDNYYYNIVIGRFIETLFTKGLTRLSVYDYGRGIFLPSLCAKCNMLSSLSELKLSDYTNTVDIKEVDIMELLKDLHNLNDLTLKCYMKFDNILMCIAENCQLIEVLTLNSNSQFDENCISSLTQLRHLKKLDLYPSDNIEGIATLLMSCENLEYVETSPPDLLNVLIYMTTLNINSGKRFKLKSNVDGRGLSITSQQLQLVVEMFPHIQEIDITNNEEDENFLMPLQHLEELRKLTLSRFEFHADHVDQLLRLSGRNLLYLEFNSVSQIDLNALMCISQSCPNLESLFIYFCRFEIGSSTCDLLHSLSITSPSFKNLKNLSTELSSTRNGYDLLQFLLSICPNLEFISTKEIPLMDEIWLRIFVLTFGDHFLICLFLGVTSSGFVHFVIRPVLRRTISAFDHFFV